MTNRELADILMLTPNNTVIIFDHNGIPHKPKVVDLERPLLQYNQKDTTVIRTSWDD